MTNTEKLQGKMREKKFTIKSLAGKVGLSSTALFNKIHNQKEFLVSEVKSVAAALALTESETYEIFFSNSVELKSTEKKREG